MRSLDALLQRSRWSESPGLRPRAPIRVRPLSRSRLASADLFGQGDDDARGAAEVTEQEDAASWLLRAGQLESADGVARRGDLT